MKSIMLKGVEVKIGDTVRFIDDSNLYKDKYDGFDTIIKPVLGKVYTVRGFSNKGGFLLEEIVNNTIETELFGFITEVEPGFGVWRFDPANPMIAEVRAVLKANKKVNITIVPEILEKLEEVLELVN